MSTAIAIMTVLNFIFLLIGAFYLVRAWGVISALNKAQTMLAITVFKITMLLAGVPEEDKPDEGEGEEWKKGKWN